MIEFKFNQGEHCIFAASGTPAEILADMGIFIENVAFALAQCGLPEKIIKSNVVMVADFAATKGAAKAKGKEA